MQQLHSRNKTVKWQKSSLGVYRQNRSTDPDKNYMIANRQALAHVLVRLPLPNYNFRWLKLGVLVSENRTTQITDQFESTPVREFRLRPNHPTAQLPVKELHAVYLKQ